MLGICLVSLLSIFQNTDSTFLIKRQAIDSINLFHSQYFPHYSTTTKSLFFTARKNKNQDENLYYSSFENQAFSKPSPLSILNEENNEGTACLSDDGKTLIFTGCDYPNSYGGCDLFESKWINENWSKPKNLGFLINSHDWEGQPNLSKDGQQLYFSSERPGGKGKRDLWLSTKNKQGIWQAPVNLGDNINTKFDEQGPYFIEHRNILIYSSDQKGGKGGLDFYQSLKVQNNFQKGQNVLQINTPNDEAGFSVGESQNEFLISSTNEGKDLIYSIVIPEEIWLKNSITKEKPNTSQSFETIKFDDVQFANNQWELPKEIPKSLIELTNFLIENPTQSIKINGHTDENGNEDLNQILSEKRALSVKLYLIQQGIPSNRIQFQGFGQSQSKSKEKAKNRRIEIEMR